MATKLRIVNKLPEFIEDVERRAARGVTQAIARIGSELPALVPVDSSNLINSQFRSVDKEGTRIVGSIGFTAEYALPVHEASGKLKGQPRPKRDGRENGVYWGPHDGQPQFLKVAADRAEADVRDIIKRSLKNE